ncbi:MAG TPA: methyltransferase domain-containing protein [Pyrinomonadaceae bacterium]|nr:methyltransferase domain-containing protein [Pyrinomonadaceae bacterium]
MIKPEQPRIEIDDLTAVIRESIAESVAAQKHDDGPAFNNGPATESTAHSTAPELKLQPDFQPRSNNRYHISDLLRYHDRAFVENAFRAILKRPPDATEFARDLKRLRSGRVNKIDLLSTLRYSNEGEAKGVEIDGLTVPALVRQLGHLPIIGYFIRLVIALVRLPDQVRDQREFAGYVLAQNQQMADFINVVSARVAECSTAVSRVEEQLSEQIRSQHEASERAAAERLNELNDHFVAEIEKQSALLDQLEPRIETRIQTEKDLLDQQIKLLTELSSTLRIEIEREAVKRRQELDQLRSQQQQSATKHEHAITAATSELREEIERVHRQLQQARAELSLQSRNLSFAAAPSVPAPTESHQLDALYAALEDRFRGTRDEIKERFKIYLPYVEPARDAGVVDLGCGRGEWLELLNESGFKTRGVERNLVQIDACRERGLDVVEDDMIAYLRKLPDESTGAVTGFHVIEHVSINALVSLFDEVMRVLRPGGVAIFETPNPENVLVGSNFFYLDPTHHHPLPSELTQFLFESRGFDRIEVLNLHPWDAGRVVGHGELTERFNGYFFGPMDYAIVGRKVQT